MLEASGDSGRDGYLYVGDRGVYFYFGPACGFGQDDCHVGSRRADDQPLDVQASEVEIHIGRAGGDFELQRHVGGDEQIPIHGAGEVLSAAAHSYVQPVVQVQRPLSGGEVYLGVWAPAVVDDVGGRAVEVRRKQAEGLRTAGWGGAQSYAAASETHAQFQGLGVAERRFVGCGDRRVGGLAEVHGERRGGDCGDEYEANSSQSDERGARRQEHLDADYHQQRGPVLSELEPDAERKRADHIQQKQDTERDQQQPEQGEALSDALYAGCAASFHVRTIPC